MSQADDTIGQTTALAPKPGGDLARWATITFVVLFAMNLLNYIDRWAMSGVIGPMKTELKINDEQVGGLTIPFLLGLSLTSPLVGWLGDRRKRTWLLAAGVGVWSLATVGTGLVRNYGELVVVRAILGIGEGTYGVLAPAILADLYPREKRSRILSAFYLAMPVGYALGLILAGETVKLNHSLHLMKPEESWRLAFFFVGAPGLLAALGALALPEPVRGQSERVDPERLAEHERAGASWEDYRELLVNSSYTYTVFGMTAFTFAFGGLAFWLVEFLHRDRGFAIDDATRWVGLTGLAAAIVGMSGGGWLADRLAKKWPSALFLVSGASMLIAVPCIVLGLMATQRPVILTWLFLAQVFMFANTGPCNAVVANVVLPRLRATAYAIMTLAIHFLGDLVSPWLMGKVSVLFGGQEMRASSFGRALASLGFEPTGDTNLGAGMLVVVPAVALGGVVLLAGMRHLPREMALMLARLKAPVSPPPTTGGPPPTTLPQSPSEESSNP